MTEELNRFIKRQTRFDPTDIFGKARIRKLIYEYDQLHKSADSEAARIREIMEKQAECVAAVIEENRKLRDDNEYYQKYIKTSDEVKSGLIAKKMEAEKTIAKLEETIQELCDKNATLVGKITVLETDYKELSDIHESLITKIEKSGLDFTIDSINEGD